MNKRCDEVGCKKIANFKNKTKCKLHICRCSSPTAEFCGVHNKQLKK